MGRLEKNYAVRLYAVRFGNLPFGKGGFDKTFDIIKPSQQD